MAPVYSVSRRMWIANMLIVVALLVSCIIPTAAVAVAPSAPRAQEADLAQRAADIAARYGVDVQLILKMVEAGVPIEIIDPNVIDAYLSESTSADDSPARQSSVEVTEESPEPVTVEVDTATLESALRSVADASPGLETIISEAHLQFAHSIDAFDIDAFLARQTASTNALSDRKTELASAFRSAASDYGINPRVLLVLAQVLSDELSTAADQPSATENGATHHLFAPTSSFHSSDGLPTEILQSASILNQEMDALKWEQPSQEIATANLDALTASEINPPSLAVYVLAALSGKNDWKERLLDPNRGFVAVYTAMFGDPLEWPIFLPSVDPSVSANWLFPYDKSKSVYYSGGPHAYLWPDYYGICVKMPRSEASGIDLNVGWGTHLLAIDIGRVVHSENHPDADVAANTVVIEHDSGIASYYIHMSGLNPNAQKGLPVPRGYYVGREGNANGKLGTHTHIELRMGGTGDWWGAANSGVPVSWEGLNINGWSVWMHHVKGDEQKGYAYQGSIVSGSVKSPLQEIQTTCANSPVALASVGINYSDDIDIEDNFADPRTRFAEEVVARRGPPLVSTNEEKTEPLPRSIDVALIIDSSGSMTWNDPQNQRKDAAKVFIDAMQNEDLVAVIDFDGGTRVAWQLQKVGADRSGPKSAVNTIDSNGGTNVGAGLQTGYNSLLTSTNGNPKAAVLLTDGRGNYNSQAALYKQKGWKIYTIGLGSDVDANLLTRIANETGGKYFPLSNPNQLVQVYFEILGAVAEGTTLRSETVRLDPQQTKTVLANLPAGQTSANFLTTWQGSTVDTKLIAPDGAVITPDTSATDPNVAHSMGLTFELYRVTNPQPGDWQIEVYGADLPAGGEDVSVTVAVRGLEGYFNAYINAPTEVSCANTAFTAEAWVVNDTNTTFLTGTATISLPVGLTFASGQASQQSLGVVLQGSQVKSEWSLIAATTGVTQTLPYTVVTTFEQGPADPMVALGAVQVPQCVLAPATASLSATPNQIIANGVSTSTINVVLQDINGVRVPNATANFTTSLGVITNAATTDANGSASVTLRSATTTGVATITAAAGVATAATQVEFIPGSPHQVAVSASPSALVADGVSAGAVVALLRDEHGNVIPNHVVSFSTTLGQIGGSATTNDEGKATTTLTSATQIGAATVTATAGAASGSTTVNFIAGPAATVSLAPTPGTILADGASTSAINAEVRDAFGNPVANQVVNFSTSLGGITAQVITDGNGKATVTLTSAAQVGIATITATAGAASGTTTVIFVGNAITGLIFVDLNRNGVRDDGESGIAGATISIVREGSATAVTLVSDATGGVAFAALPAGVYKMSVTPPSGFSATTATEFTLTLGADGVSAPAVGVIALNYLPLLMRN